MSITEAERFTMHAGLQENLGEEVANILMEHLPPVGWADVATKHDLIAFETRTDMRFVSLEERMSLRIENLEERMNLRIENLEERMNLRFEKIDLRISELDKRMTLQFMNVDQSLGKIDESITLLTRTMWALTGLMTSAVGALFYVVITKL
jgi:hypothetical protein